MPKRIMRKTLPANLTKHRETPKAVRKVRQQEVLRHYSQGTTVPVIADKMGMRIKDVSRDLNIALADMVKQYAQVSPEQQFVRYASFQMGIVQTLRDDHDQLMKDAKAKQYGAAIAALKAQSEIYDRVLTKGTEFGVIQKTQARENIRTQPNDMRIELRREIVTLTSLLDEIDGHTHTHSLNPKPVSKFTRRMRRVQHNQLGIVKAIPDWKFRKNVFNDKGEVVPKADYSQDQLDQLHPSLQDSVIQLQTELDKHSQPQTTDDQQSKSQTQELKVTKETWLVTPSR